MSSRIPVRAVIDLRSLSSALPSTTFAARRAFLHNASSSTQFRESHPETPPQTATTESRAAFQQSKQQLPPSTTRDLPPVLHTSIPSPKAPIPPTFTEPVSVTDTILNLLPHLTSQSPHYVTAHIHARPYLLTVGDTVRLPFLMPDVETGDIIRLNRASVLGSRDFVFRGAPYIDERMFECRARVLGVESEPMRMKEKTKRRQRHVQTVRSKHKYTILKVMQIKIKTVDELMAEGAKLEQKGGSL
ncbi:hypothetical protein LOZ58_004563 [Ophidiomyces ophidiicola]|nr:hypothetical protein LOZ65_003974 [Ophidiomyces ophidiicola]KAI1959292.1 hypothetical protein LOZ58_004563 [Ophidiomyces ophidiicola]